MLKNTILLFALVVFALLAVNFMHQDKPFNLGLERLRQKYSIKPVSGVDHTKLPELDREFESPQDVTLACLQCHTERHKEIMASAHWNWERVGYIEGRGVTWTGKNHVLNNFCIGSNSNEQACSKCHVGFGVVGNQDRYSEAANVDCMVCHDNSEAYFKGAALAGYPDRTVNLKAVAQHVGKPKKSNCGACHFYGGGGNNVKHGDLEEALMSCEREVDVHMAQNGMDMSCVACHTAENHVIKGKLYSVSSEDVNRSTCEQCHTARPHFDNLLNRHFARVSCQACHIPEFAKVNATKMSWKWSEAGRLKDGKPYHEDGADGDHTYLSEKGSFVWKKNVKPDYVWFNGTADHYILGDLITGIPVQMNRLSGSPDDPKSKIVPVKIHRGDQIYDKKNNYLIQPKLYGPDEADSAFWSSFSWEKAAAAGMQRLGLPYSGEFGFVETEMYWPVNHMVSPAEQAVRCEECHIRRDGRLAGLAGFYLPGRDRSRLADIAGTLLILLSLAGVAGHSAMRIGFSLKYKKSGAENG